VSPSLRILVHDYAGHPFPVQLSRELARRGHVVLHLHCPSYRTGKGALETRPDDPGGFACEGVELAATLEKYSLWKRPLQELEYARPLIRRTRRFRPDLVLSANTPLIVQTRFLAACRRDRVPFVFWQQDLHGLAMQSILRERLPFRGAGIGRLFPAIERALLRRSDAVVTIAREFATVDEGWGVRRERLSVIENWAPVDELPDLEPNNAWAREVGVAGQHVLLYSGTLGLKHDPDVLLRLAQHYRERGDVTIVVVSESETANRLAAQARAQGLSLIVLPFQPYERLAEMHGAADVLLVLLERDLSSFSVPSKVLTYHCAGRALLGAMPAENPAARIIESSGAGLVVEPGDHQAFLAAADRLLADDALRTKMGHRARTYAESTFSIATIADSFESVIQQVASSRA
jgi:putative colanic acid biosynthesis glycosyltransferase WcaI